MPIPRFRDADGEYEIILSCPKCAWAITKDRVTMKWKVCRNPGCDGKLVTRRNDYPYRHLEDR